jgi:hypothetical protein
MHAYKDSMWQLLCKLFWTFLATKQALNKRAALNISGREPVTSGIIMSITTLHYVGEVFNGNFKAQTAAELGCVQFMKRKFLDVTSDVS